MKPRGAKGALTKFVGDRIIDTKIPVATIKTITANTFNTKVMNQMNDMDKDGLNSTRFRIVKREKFHEKHEIIEVLI